jgi:hypothetical protein
VTAAKVFARRSIGLTAVAVVALPLTLPHGALAAGPVIALVLLVLAAGLPDCRCGRPGCPDLGREVAARWPYVASAAVMLAVTGVVAVMLAVAP